MDVLRPDPRRWRLLGLMCLAQFMVVLDVTVVNVALPTIGVELRLERGAVAWVLIAYTLCFGGLMLLGGRLADLLGRRGIFLAGLAVFTVASLGAGFASSAGTLITARVVQGIGAALLAPSALSIITAAFSGAERQRALAVSAAIGGGGAAAGVLVGGLLVAGPGWEWIFFVNVPVGLCLGAAVLVAVPAYPGQRGRVDLLGALIVTAGLASLIFGLVGAGDRGWGAPVVMAAIGAGLALVAGFVVVARRSPSPLVSWRLLTARSTLSGMLVMLVATVLVIGSFFVASVYLQRVVGLSPLGTAQVFLPMMVGVVAGSQLAARAVTVHGGRPVAAAGFAVAGVGLAVLSWVTGAGRLGFAGMVGFVVLAAGAGTAFVVATTTTVGSVDAHESGAASAVLNTTHELGASLGIAVLATLAGPSVDVASAGVPPVAGFGRAFLGVALLAGVAAIALPGLLPPARPAAAPATGRRRFLAH